MAVRLEPGTEVLPPPENRVAAVARRLLRDPATVGALVFILLVAMVALLAPWLAPYDPVRQSIRTINRPPSAAHWLGTDQFGRDVLSRLIHGARNSLVLGLISPVLSATIGTALGVVAGYFGGFVDRVISRVVDILLAFPELLLGIMIAAALGSSFWDVVVVLTIAFIPRFARIARAQTLSVRSEPYVEAAIAVGVRAPLLLYRHVVPNVSAAVVVLMTLTIASAIRLEATLSFLGLGTQPPHPSWGNIIRDGLGNIFGTAWPIVAAGLAITLTVLAFSVIGDAVRDALDPDTSE